MIRKYSEAEEGNKDKEKKWQWICEEICPLTGLKKSRYKGDTFEKKRPLKPAQFQRDKRNVYIKV